jgi:myosin heavy subunit
MVEHCFIRSEDDVFRLVKIVRREGQEVVVDNNGEATKFKLSEISMITEEELEQLDSSPPKIADLIHLTTVSQETILYTLRRRYDHDLIYTSIGSILIALNPFKNMGSDLYSERMINNYHHNESNPHKNEDGSMSEGLYSLEETPHVYAVSQLALQGISSPSGEDQSLIISGESGAGKTEATKHCLHYLASTSGSTGGSDAHIRLQTASPVLEAWGNAKTLRNNNSSRFGKFIEIWFGEGQKAITKSVNTTYLLEKTRVISQEHNERNYHVFYQLLKGGGADLLDKLYLTDIAKSPLSARFLHKSGVHKIDGVDDLVEFR